MFFGNLTFDINGFQWFWGRSTFGFNGFQWLLDKDRRSIDGTVSMDRSGLVFKKVDFLKMGQ